MPMTRSQSAEQPAVLELISRISRKIADGPADEIWISKFDWIMHTANYCYPEKLETYAYLP